MRGNRYEKIRAPLYLAFVLVSLVITKPASADVYMQSPLDDSHVGTLASLMPKSISPGGIRQVRINGSPMTITRLVTPSARDVLAVMDRYIRPYIPKEQDLSDDYAQLEKMFVEREKYSSDDALDLAMSLMWRERDRVVDNLERPIAYQAGRWTVISRIPMSAVQPENVLATTPVTDGFIVFLDDSTQADGYSSAWEIRFNEGFRLLDIIGHHEGDAPGSSLLGILKPPGSKRTLVYEEKANRWDSATWSYEAPGTVEGNLNYFVSQLQKLGFTRRGPAIRGESESMVQMSRAGETVVVHAVNLTSSARPIQVTIQRLS